MRKPLLALSLVVSTSLGVIQAANARAASPSSSPQSTAHSSPATVPAASNNVSGAQIVATAMKYLGYPYTATGNSPSTGFSCIGFASYVYRQNGIPLPGDLQDALDYAPQVSFSQLEPGDLMFFKNTVWTGLSHVAIYIGGGKMIHAEWYGRGVTITSFRNDPVDGNYWPAKYMTANRPWGGASVPVTVPANTTPVNTTPPAAPTTIHSNAPTGIVSATSGVNLRSGHWMKASVIETVPKGTTVYIIGHAGNWYKVQLPDGTIGWMIKSGVITSQTATSNAVASASANTPSTASTVTSSVSGLRVHASASFSASVVTTLYKGQKVEVIARRNGWVEIRLPNGKTGWVDASYLKGNTVKAAAGTASQTSPGTFHGGHTATVGVNVRSGPSLNDAVVAGIPAGGSYQIIGRRAGWLHVRLPNGATGWVDGAYVKGGTTGSQKRTATRSSSGIFHGGHTAKVGVNVRSGPSIRDAVVAGIPVGGSYQILGWKNGWAHIRLPNGSTGWVDGAVIGGASATYSDKTASSTLFTHRTTAGVRVHSRPGLASPVVGLLATGTRVEVLRYFRTWIRVRSKSGLLGWVYGTYVR